MQFGDLRLLTRVNSREQETVITASGAASSQVLALRDEGVRLSPSSPLKHLVEAQL